MSLYLWIQLWERPDRAADLTAFEDAVLELLPTHGGRLVARGTVTDRADDDPLEVQLIEVPDEQSLASYMADPVRIELARNHDRDAIIARTRIVRSRRS